MSGKSAQNIKPYPQSGWGICMIGCFGAHMFPYYRQDITVSRYTNDKFSIFNFQSNLSLLADSKNIHSLVLSVPHHFGWMKHYYGFGFQKQESVSMEYLSKPFNAVWAL